MSFKESRKRPGDVKVHLDSDELIKYVKKERAAQERTIKEYAYFFTMEDLSAYEYGNQFALHSVMQWREVAIASGLRYSDDFYREYMMADVQTRELRESSDIIENFEDVLKVL